MGAGLVCAFISRLPVDLQQLPSPTTKERTTLSIMHSLLYRLFAVLVILSTKQVTSTEVAITNEEYIDEDYGYYGGDIILTEWQKEMLEGKEAPPLNGIEMDGNEAHNVNRRAVVKNDNYLWPNGIVPYVLDRSLDSRAERAIKAAMSEYEAKTCIQFVQRTSQSAYIRFIKDRGCYSYVGRTGRAGQEISIGSGCQYTGIVTHEIFHALGRWHEQSRPDRDNHVKVNYQNIRSGTATNFNKLSENVATTQSIPYDLKSVMHYDAYAFSTNGRPTIEPRDSRVKMTSIGQRQGFTDLDLQHVNALYRCNNQPPGGSGSWGPWGSWSSCSVTCGSGVQTRRRTCIGSGCTGQSLQTRSCNRDTCMARNTWAQWGSWSSCSVTCGYGRHTRTRSCQGTGCLGANTQTQFCNPGGCPASSGWGPWSSWTPCASTCGGGLQFRSRKCLSSCRSGTSYELRRCGRWQCSPNLDSSLQNSSSDQAQLSLADSKHVSCQMVDTQSDIQLSSSQGVLSTVISGRFQTSEAKEKCIDLAKFFNYTYIGVMGGYCISVKNFTEDHSSAPVYDQCEDGNGKYDPSSTIQYMDVYRITSSDSQSIKSASRSSNGALSSIGSTVSHIIGLFSTLFFCSTYIEYD